MKTYTRTCDDCGSTRVTDNAACGNVDCCGPLTWFCLDCGESNTSEHLDEETR